MNKIIKTSVLIFTVIMLIFAVLLSSFMIGRYYTNPLGEPMKGQITQAPLTSGMVSAATAVPATATAAPAAVVTATPAATVVAAAQTTETCGQSGVMRVLFIGAHNAVSAAPLGAESVRLLKVDYDHKTVTIVAFPRDLLLKTPALSGLSISQSRLGPAYRYKKDATTGSEAHQVTQASAMVAQTLYDNFAYPETLDDYYYFNVRVDEMGDMVNTIGGVEVTIPQTFTNERGITFWAGKQTLNGRLSMEFVNSLRPGGEPARLERQNLFARALQAEIFTPDTLTKLPDLYKQFDQAIVTDLSPQQIESLACMAKEVPQKDFDLYEISVQNGLAAAARDGALIPNADKIKAALKNWFGE